MVNEKQIQSRNPSIMITLVILSSSVIILCYLSSSRFLFLFSPFFLSLSLALFPLISCRNQERSLNLFSRMFSSFSSSFPGMHPHLFLLSLSFWILVSPDPLMIRKSSEGPPSETFCNPFLLREREKERRRSELQKEKREDS